MSRGDSGFRSQDRERARQRPPRPSAARRRIGICRAGARNPSFRPRSDRRCPRPGRSLRAVASPPERGGRFPRVHRGLRRRRRPGARRPGTCSSRTRTSGSRVPTAAREPTRTLRTSPRDRGRDVAGRTPLHMSSRSPASASPKRSPPRRATDVPRAPRGRRTAGPLKVVAYQRRDAGDRAVPAAPCGRRLGARRDRLFDLVLVAAALSEPTDPSSAWDLAVSAPEEAHPERAQCRASFAAHATWVRRLPADKGLPAGAPLSDGERARLLRAAGPGPVGSRTPRPAVGGDC